ncbi:MAG: hypothetical protein SFY66_14915 [Oculatellaceae cyanobacterium bins.114]|nr:hypothetical protein [Oculatellaceae cyanobacterium bins.114]
MPTDSTNEGSVGNGWLSCGVVDGKWLGDECRSIQEIFIVSDRPLPTSTSHQRTIRFLLIHTLGVDRLLIRYSPIAPYQPQLPIREPSVSS